MDTTQFTDGLIPFRVRDVTEHHGGFLAGGVDVSNTPISQDGLVGIFFQSIDNRSREIAECNCAAVSVRPFHEVNCAR